MLWQTIGFGLSVGWLWLFFLSGPILTELVKPWPEVGGYNFQLFLICGALSYLFIGHLVKNSSLLSKKNWVVFGTISISFSSGLISLLLSQVYPTKPFIQLIYPLTVIGALGMVIMLLTWLETFIKLSIKKTCLVYTGGIAMASLLLFTSAFIELKIGVWLSVLIPLLSFTFFQIYLKSGSSSPVKMDIDLPSFSNKKVFPVKLICLILLFYGAGGMMFKLVGLKYVFANFFWASNIAYLIVVIGAGFILYFFPNLDLRLLYRPVLPLLAAGFCLFPFLKGGLVISSFLLLQAGFALFDMFTWLLIVYIARDSSRPVAVLGQGMFWILFSLFIGNIAFSALTPLIPINRQPDSLVIIAGLITMLAALVFQENKETFAGWETKVEHSTSEPQLTVQTNPDYSFSLEKYNLTPRESEILLLILKGRNNPFIREKLNISPNTLKFHLRNIFNKFEVNNRQELLDLVDTKSSNSK